MILVKPPGLNARDAGIVLGLLIGEGHFGGDGRQPHVVLRMHTRHERLFRWLKERFPYARLYGPYAHSGRHYFQFMWRGTALRYGLMPLLEALPWEQLDAHSFARYTAMKARYELTDVPAADRARFSVETERPLLGDPGPAREPGGGDDPLLEDEDPPLPG